MTSPLSIRIATPEDAAHTLAIYAPYVTDTDITFETEVPSLEEWTARMRNTLARYPYLVAAENGIIVGYAYASPFRSKAAYDWSIETTIYLPQGRIGSGIGGRLYDSLETILRAQGIANMNACITYPNPASIAFHHRMGYTTVGRFTGCGYKQGRWLDMVWMEKHIAPHAGTPPAFIPFPQLPPVTSL